MPDERPADGPGGPTPIWSGNLAFGRVAVPVELFSALRRERVQLRVVDDEGTPLVRRYYCTREGVPVGEDELVRGYPVGEDEYVLVQDDELEALAPEMSAEIALRRFVPRAELDPALFDRAYVLVPAEGATRAYRLLARVLHESDRAGIATFVMRTREHLVAVVSEHGLLLAETLRFAAELRTPAEVGLAAPAAADTAQAARLAKELTTELEVLRANDLDTGDLRDRYAHRLRNLVEAKLEEGDDVLHAMAERSRAAEEGEDEAPLDLMRVLKRSLVDAELGAGGGAEPGASAGRSGASDDLAERSKAELYERAKQRDVSGRSRMSKRELIEALRR